MAAWLLSIEPEGGALPLSGEAQEAIKGQSITSELGANPQQAHYEAVHDAYEAHYYDQSSMRYRRRFIYDFLFSNIDLNGASVADLACGSGHNSLALRKYFPSARTVGYDISASACRDYGSALAAKLTRLISPDRSMDRSSAMTRRWSLAVSLIAFLTFRLHSET